jgi:hypothetical protein
VQRECQGDEKRKISREKNEENKEKSKRRSKTIKFNETLE